MLSRIDRCSNDVSCVTTPISERRLSCVTFGDILAIDGDAPAFEIVETKQQIHQCRLAGAGAADQTDLLARLDIEGQVVDDTFGLAIVEADMIEVDRPCLAAIAGAAGTSTISCGFVSISMPS